MSQPQLRKELRHLTLTTSLSPCPKSRASLFRHLWGKTDIVVPIGKSIIPYSQRSAIAFHSYRAAKNCVRSEDRLEVLGVV